MNNELNAYIGMTIESLLKKGYSPSQTKHLITAGLVEYLTETLDVKDDLSTDYYAISPLFVAVKRIIDKEFKDKQDDAYMPEIQADMAKLKALSNYLEHRIEVANNLC